MTPFMETLRSEATPQLKDFPRVKSDDRHNIQTHVVYLDLLVSIMHNIGLLAQYPHTSLYVQC